MNCLSRMPSCAAVVFRRANGVVSRHSASFAVLPPPSEWGRTSSLNAPVGLGLMFRKCRVRCYSRSSKKGTKATVTKSRLKTADAKPVDVDREKGAFYVVRKGDVVGVYRSFGDCKAQFGSSIRDPPVSVLKGYNLPAESMDYILSRGLKDAIYTMNAADLKDDLFGMLTPCPVVEPASYRVDATQNDGKGSTEASADALDDIVPTSILAELVSSSHSAEKARASINCQSCTIEFDGASKGNPGKGGAGAVLRADDGTLVCKIWEGLGQATNNVAEYRAIILGMKYALQKGYTSIHVRGDSKLVYMQVQGLWKVRHKEMAKLLKVVKALREHFLSFEISHVLRALNKEADSLANKGVNLADGQVEEECVQLS